MAVLLKPFAVAIHLKNTSAEATRLHWSTKILLIFTNISRPIYRNVMLAEVKQNCTERYMVAEYEKCLSINVLNHWRFMSVYRLVESLVIRIKKCKVINLHNSKVHINYS